MKSSWVWARRDLIARQGSLPRIFVGLWHTVGPWVMKLVPPTRASLFVLHLPSFEGSWKAIPGVGEIVFSFYATFHSIWYVAAVLRKCVVFSCHCGSQPSSRFYKERLFAFQLHRPLFLFFPVNSIVSARSASVTQ